MKAKIAGSLSTALLVLFVSTACVNAAMITNYRTYRASTATTLGGQGTDDPVIGATSATANMAFLMGYLDSPAVLGNDLGDTVTLTFGVHFNDATGMTNNGDNFRFALFDRNGEGIDPSPGSPNFNTAGSANTNNFRGYMIGVRNGMGTGSGGSIRERTGALASGDNPFAVTSPNNASAPSLGAIGGNPVTLISDVNGNAAGADYLGVLTLTRIAGGLVNVSGSFKGSNSTNENTFSVNDTTLNSSSSYGAVGFLFGMGISVDQATFKDVDVTAIPEPASMVLLFGSSVVWGGLRQRRK